MPLLFPWRPDLKPEAFNEDRAGRALDTLAPADPHKVFRAIAQKGVLGDGVDPSWLHADTTSKGFSGAYDEEDAGEGAMEEAALRITYGYSRDKRPDLKQILVGVGVTPEGIPVCGQVLDGNPSDMTFNGQWIPKGREWLGKEPSGLLV